MQIMCNGKTLRGNQSVLSWKRSFVRTEEEEEVTFIHWKESPKLKAKNIYYASLAPLKM
jgi:hypothetical protein